jgi:hypothetical protein
MHVPLVPHGRMDHQPAGVPDPDDLRGRPTGRRRTDLRRRRVLAGDPSQCHPCGVAARPRPCRRAHGRRTTTLPSSTSPSSAYPTRAGARRCAPSPCCKTARRRPPSTNSTPTSNIASPGSNGRAPRSRRPHPADTGHQPGPAAAAHRTAHHPLTAASTRVPNVGSRCGIRRIRRHARRAQQAAITSSAKRAAASIFCSTDMVSGA